MVLFLGSSSVKHSTPTIDRGHSIDVIGDGGEAREGSEGVEEVLVEVDEEGAMVDEFRQEQQLEKTKKKLSRGKIEKYGCHFLAHLCMQSRVSAVHVLMEVLHKNTLMLI